MTTQLTAGSDVGSPGDEPGFPYSIHPLSEGVWELRAGALPIARLEEWGTSWILTGCHDRLAPEVFTTLPAALTAATYRY